MRFWLVFLIFNFFTSSSMLAASRPLGLFGSNLQTLWNKVEEAENKKLPKTALEHIEEILEITKDAKSRGPYLKALAKKLLNQAHIQGDHPRDRIKFLRSEIDSTNAQDRPILRAILAIWFWTYHDQNRYKFSQRTTTSGLENDDFTTWDSALVFAEAIKLFESALQDKENLKKLALVDYSPIYEGGTLGSKFCNTLYELLAREALVFFKHADQALPRPQDAFEIEADAGALGALEDFLKYVPKTTDTDSLLLKSINQYQELLAFLKEREQIDALVDTEIERLVFFHGKAVGSSKDSIFIQRLEEIEKDYSGSSVSTLAVHQLALMAKNSGDLVSAVEICSRAIDRFPNSDGAKLCQNLINEITIKDFDIKIEHTINASNSMAQIEYKNLTRLYFRVVKDNWRRVLEEDWSNPGDYLRDDGIVKLLRQEPVAEWSVALEDTPDYKLANEEIKLPPLKHGYYRLFVSHNQDFNRRSENKLVHSPFWVTDTTLLMRNLRQNIHGLIVDSRTGRPQVGKTVEIYKRGDRGRFAYHTSLQTQNNGTFIFEKEYSRYYGSYLFLARTETGEVLFHQALGHGEFSRKSKTRGVLFYTDRSIYRPGQTIRFKGVCYEKDPTYQIYEVWRCRNLSVILRDANYQEVEQQRFSANEFGSFSGDFTAPKGQLTGVYTIYASSSGSTSFRVEEYKRPKFEVELMPIDQEVRLDETVEVKGQAKTYAGVSVGGATVKYRVLRSVRMPWWWRWYNPFNGSREIVNGRVETDEQGNFKIPFVALPDRSVAPEMDANFNYEVQVDVIDPTGETRSASRSVKVGYSAIEARLSLPDWLVAEEEISLAIRTNTIDGKAVDNVGKIKIMSLKQPEKPVRQPAQTRYYWWGFTDSKSSKARDLSDFRNWEEGEEISSYAYSTKNGAASLPLRMAPGAYRAKLETTDKFGKVIRSEISFIVFSGETSNFPVKVPSFFQLHSASLAPGDLLKAVWGTGYEGGSAFVSFIREGEILKSYWTNPSESLHQIRFPVSKDLRGGFTLQIYFVQENQVYSYSRLIDVKYPEKDLKVTFQTFRDKLEPNAKETWSLVIEGKDAQKVASEMVATLYDESLDSFYPHSFAGLSNIFWKDGQAQTYMTNLFSKTLMEYYSNFHRGYHSINRTYPHFPYWLKQQLVYLFPKLSVSRGIRFKSLASASFVEEGVMMDNYASADEGGMMLAQAAPASAMEKKSMRRGENELSKADSPKAKEPEEKIVPRSNLSETAFFYPHLLSDENGRIEIRFQMPEALTRWKFMALAHGKGLEWGQVVRSVVTQKELMIEPHMPRFLRQGDRVVLTAKVSNLATGNQSGRATIEFFNAMTGETVSEKFLQSNPSVDFEVPAGQSKVVDFEIKVPDITFPLQFKVMARTQVHADGEEGVIPILSRTTLVREAKPLWVHGPGERSVDFKSLLNSGTDGAVHEKLVLQMASHPGWYAVQALPYLQEYPNESTDQVFNRLYANSLGTYIANSQPRIEKIFEQWKGTDALDSNLQKNEDLKSVMLKETPWVLEAQNQTASKRRVAIFFDRNRMSSEIENTIKELKRRMYPDGGWPWFPGGRKSEFFTLYVVTGLGRLRHLGVDIDVEMALKSVRGLDIWVKGTYERLRKYSNLEDNHYSNLIAYYLYGRSFFLKEKPIVPEAKEAVSYYLNQAKRYWTGLGNRMGEGHTALGLMRFDDQQVPTEIMASLRERALHDEELGMYWGDEEFAYWWYRAPIETQAIMIEAFYELGGQEKEIEDLKVWLLKQKQTQDWKTNKATADAIYAMLLRGADLLAGTKLVKVWVGDEEVEPEKVEAGTGFFEKRWTASQIRPEQGKVKMVKEEKGTSWGGLHWHYFQDLSKIKAHGNNLNLEKKLFVKRNTKKGPVITPLENMNLEVGDTLVVRVILRADRDFEYVHMKDSRGSGTEPVNVLSYYKYQDGLAYYESTKDTATHFYFDYLPKGTYVFEYDLKIFHKGDYTAGMAEIECLYAPEFRAHSEAFPLQVK